MNRLRGQNGQIIAHEEAIGRPALGPVIASMERMQATQKSHEVAIKGMI